jgi:hypothetical protein
MGTVVFRNVWYRNAPNRGRTLTLISFQDRGALVVSKARIDFVGRRTRLAIPVEQIERISLRRQGWDVLNRWIVIDYGPGKQAYFHDGRRLGWSGVLGGTRRMLRRIRKTLWGV